MTLLLIQRLYVWCHSCHFFMSFSLMNCSKLVLVGYSLHKYPVLSYLVILVSGEITKHNHLYLQGSPHGVVGSKAQYDNSYILRRRLQRTRN